MDGRRQGDGIVVVMELLQTATLDDDARGQLRTSSDLRRSLLP